MVKRVLAVASVVALAATVSCSTSSSPITPCTTSIAVSPNAFGAAGGSGTVTISTGANCAWALTADTWIILGTTTGQGPATVGMTLALNPGESSRLGSVAAGAARAEVTQGGSPTACAYALSPADVLTLPQGQQTDVTIHTGPGCPWNASSDASWISLTGAVVGSGPGTFTFAAAPTPSPNQQRVGTITVQGAGGRADASVRQLAMCNILFTEPRAGGRVVSTTVNVAAAGESTVFWALTEPWICNWTAVADAAWIAVDSPRYPMVQLSDGHIRFTAEPNPTGVERRGEIRAGDKTLTIIQAPR